MAFLRSSDFYAVVCRPALPKDTADVMALTSQIWEGHDYVPHYWEAWLQDSEGLLAVAEYAGYVVGLSKISRVGSDQWWLQGLRVHPTYQGKGIGSHLHNYMVRFWEQSCGGVLRLATSSARLPVHHLCEKSGFLRVGEFLSYVAPALESGSSNFFPISLDEAETALAFARETELFEISSGLLVRDWVWVETRFDYFYLASKEGRLYWWSSGGVHKGLLAFAVVDEDEGKYLTIELLTSELKMLADLLRQFRSLAGLQGCSQAAWFAPIHEGVINALIEAGYVKDWENSLYIYEKRLQS